jgi:hypothetical protein
LNDFLIVQTLRQDFTSEFVKLEVEQLNIINDNCLQAKNFITHVDKYGLVYRYGFEFNKFDIHREEILPILRDKWQISVKTQPSDQFSATNKKDYALEVFTELALKGSQSIGLDDFLKNHGCKIFYVPYSPYDLNHTIQMTKYQDCAKSYKSYQAFALIVAIQEISCGVMDLELKKIVGNLPPPKGWPEFDEFYHKHSLDISKGAILDVSRLEGLYYKLYSWWEPLS